MVAPNRQAKPPMTVLTYGPPKHQTGELHALKPFISGAVLSVALPRGICRSCLFSPASIDLMLDRYGYVGSIES